MNNNQDENKTKQKITLQEILNGDFLIRDWFHEQYKLFLMICGLTFLYIFFGFQAELQQYRLNELKKELQNKHYEQLTIEAELTERTRQSNMGRELSERGSQLKENKQPVTRIH